jgi:hypothetical protein
LALFTYLSLIFSVFSFHVHFPSLSASHLYCSIKSRDSAVCIANGYGLDDQGVESRWENNFHFSMSSKSALRPTQLPIQWVRGALSPGVKWPGRKSDHSPPTSAEVKKTRVYTSTTPYVFIPIRLHGVVLDQLNTGTSLLLLKWTQL